MTQDHTTAAPVCYRHPDRQTLLSCSRCGKPICSACSIDAAVGQRCPDCVRAEGPQKVMPGPPTPRPGGRVGRTAGAPATLTILIVTVVMYFLSSTQGGDTVAEALAQKNFLIASGEWWRIFTPVLVHGGFMHLLFNMWALWALGPQIERGVGSWPFVGLYLASAGVGGVFMYYTGPLGLTAVGASGAIFGLFGVWIGWAFHRRRTAMGRAMLAQIGFLLLINAALPFLVPGIGWQAHLGGLLAGLAIGELWRLVRGPGAQRIRTAIAFGVAILAVVAVLI